VRSTEERCKAGHTAVYKEKKSYGSKSRIGKEKRQRRDSTCFAGSFLNLFEEV
jgi:hypothetical protein